MKLDILVFAAHPDDAELACGGTILKEVSQGKKVGIIDLTLGELGTRGTVDIRRQEAANSARILGLSARENLEMPDGFFDQTRENLEKIIRVIRHYKPDIVLANAVSDRHPDHARGSEIVSRACFLSGLVKIPTTRDGQEQERWRPQVIYHYVQFRYLKPDFVVDISNFMDQKLEAIQAFKSQFYDPENKQPKTMISSAKFLDYIKARAAEYGAAIEVPFGEGFVTERPLHVSSLEHTLT
jgi:bacillithiol biosynthesis deacetylase BshB1